MLVLQLRFPSGRYHATRWGTHVNEGDVEWPPSPWRICRSLIAAGFARHGWEDVPPDARRLIEALAEGLPTWHLPPGATVAHSRHYMPLYNGKTTKVLDTFVHVGTERVLAASWPVTLEPELRRLLADLLGSLNWLGRAESWIDASLAEDVPEGLLPCPPSEHPPGPGHDPLRLLAPVDPATYDAWLSPRVDAQLAKALAEKRAKAEAKGKKPPLALSSKERESAAAQLPADLIAALRMSTADLQKAGWSQPPGSRSVTWWRPTEALAAEPRRPPVRGSVQPPTVALLAITPDSDKATPLPPLRDAIRRAGTVHQALVRLRPVAVFTGKEGGKPLSGHQHAHVLPLTLEQPVASRPKLPSQRIDHFLVYAPMGFDEVACDALLAVPATYGKNLPRLGLSCVALGGVQGSRALIPSLGSGRVWVSETPYVPPRFLKARGRHSLEGQIREELAVAGLHPTRVEIEAETAADGVSRWVPASGWVEALEVEEGSAASHRLRRASWWRHFRIARDDERGPPQRLALGLRLVFDAPVAGPVLIGYGRHFGLGRLVPERP